LFFINRVSPYLIKKYGKRNINIVEIISLLSSFITIFSWFYSISNPKAIPFIYSFIFNNLLISILIICTLLSITFYLLLVLLYSRFAKCSKCKKEFAYNEYKKPDIHIIGTKNGDIRKTVRYYQCTFCGDEKTKTIIEETE